MEECLIQYETILISAFFLPVLSSLGLLWFLLLYQKKKYQYENEQKDAKLREQALIIQNQVALNYERNRIASEMHDELGSGLTIIKYLSDNIITKTSDIEITHDTEKIAGYSTTLVRNMSEIIWALNSRFDDVEGMVSYLRRYFVEYLDDNNIQNTFIMDVINPKISISGEKRRNLFLVVKELLHNSVKYSQASEINILVSGQNELNICVKEIGGIGFDPFTMKEKGNGLFNIEKRMKNIDGSITYHKTEHDMIITISLPVIKENKDHTNQSKTYETKTN